MTSRRFEMCAAAALQPFVRCLVNRGINPSYYLERQKIPTHLVESGEGHIVKRQAWDFFDDVKRREGLFEFGFLDGDPYSSHDLGSIGVALQHAVTLKDGIETFSRLVADFAEGNVIDLVVGKTLSWVLCYTEKQDPNVHAADQHTILILREVVRIFAGPDWQPKQIWYLSTPMKPFKVMEDLASIESTFSQCCAGIAFSSELLANPVVTDQRINLQSNNPNTIAQPPKTTSGIITYILRSWLINQKIPTFVEVADILSTSRMTLFRELEEEKILYRQIVERVRFELAKDLLQDPNLSIKEISYQLCYSATSSFSRAFTRMSGFSPTIYRHKKFGK